MSVGIEVDYDGLTFNSGVADANGTQWYLDQLDGWDSPTPRVASADPTTRHGTVISRVVFDARAMVVGGTVKSPDLASHWAAYYGIDQAFNNLGFSRQLTVTEDIDRYVAAMRTGSVRKTLIGGCAFTFQINLSCPDPLKYAATPITTTIGSGASATLTNAGNFPTELITVTTGGAGAFKVVNETVGGNGVLSDKSIPSGAVFDFMSRDVLNASGDDIYGSLASSSEWFTIQPGDNTVTNHGASSVDIVFTPSWI